MKSKIIRLRLLILSLRLSSCVSAKLEFGDSFTGSVTPGERITAGAIDLDTLPAQLPVIVAM